MTTNDTPVFYEADGVTPLRHVAWTSTEPGAPGIRPSDIPDDGAPMEWQIPGQGFWDL